MEFVCFEADDNNDVILEDVRLSEVETVSDTEFIDDTGYNESVENYYALENVSTEYDDAIGDSFPGFDFSQESNNYCCDDNICDEVIDEFKDFKKRLTSLRKL